MGVGEGTPLPALLSLLFLPVPLARSVWGDPRLVLTAISVVAATAAVTVMTAAAVTVRAAFRVVKGPSNGAEAHHP